MHPLMFILLKGWPCKISLILPDCFLSKTMFWLCEEGKATCSALCSQIRSKVLMRAAESEDSLIMMQLWREVQVDRVSLLMQQVIMPWGKDDNDWCHQEIKCAYRNQTYLHPESLSARVLLTAIDRSKGNEEGIWCKAESHLYSRRLATDFCPSQVRVMSSGAVEMRASYFTFCPLVKVAILASLSREVSS